MAALTKFTISPSGQLVYKSNGRLAPSSYTFKKNTVYGPDGRRIGSLSRNLTKTQASKIAKAERNRAKKGQKAQKKVSTPPKQGKPRQPSKGNKFAGPAAFAEYGEGDWDEFEGTDFPEESFAVKNEFAARVRAAAASVAPPALQSKIMALSTEALWRGYEEDAYIFELFFKYHSPVDAPHTSDVSVWLYQFVKRIETYMGVSS